MCYFGIELHDDHFLCRGSFFGHVGICSILCPLVFRMAHHLLHVDHALHGTLATLVSKQHHALVLSISGCLLLFGRGRGGLCGLQSLRNMPRTLLLLLKHSDSIILLTTVSVVENCSKEEWLGPGCFCTS